MLAGLAAYVLFGNVNEKKGYILNQEVFNGFKGKQELESKLGKLQQQHKTWLDSVGSLIAQRNDPALIRMYQENASNFRLQEEELSQKYTADIWKRINHHLAGFGKENGYDFIFGASGDGSLMYADDARNITSEVIPYINARYESGE